MSEVRFARLLSFGVGFLSLSQEILFVRLVGFAYESTPSAFAFVLVFFLLGIALGANAGKRLCARGGDLRTAGGYVLLAAGALDAAVPTLAYWFATTPLASIGLALLVLFTAALKSVLFPIAHELGSATTGAAVGRSISKVYASNIAGSTLGPLVTGFVLLDVVSLEHAFRLVGVATLLLGGLCVMRSRRAHAVAAALAALLVGAWAQAAPRDLLPIFAMRDTDEQRPNLVIERRAGIIHTLAEPKGGDAVYGGNVYDGRVNTSLRVNSNDIHRAYILAALHPRIERILVLGLSSGAWTRVLSQFPEVQRIDAVEINAGYLELIARHPEVAPILDDPRIHIHADDARRWLNRHPDDQYDVIVMNTSYYWRAYSTNLLSREFLQLARRHLRPGGVMTYNTTSSPDVLWTAADVFPFVRRYVNFAYVAEHDFTAGIEARRERVWAIGEPGHPLLSRDSPDDVKAVQKMFAVPFVTPQFVARHAGRPLSIITDDNMASEYRHGRGGLFMPARE